MKWNQLYNDVRLIEEYGITYPSFYHLFSEADNQIFSGFYMTVFVDKMGFVPGENGKLNSETLLIRNATFLEIDNEMKEESL